MRPLENLLLILDPFLRDDRLPFQFNLHLRRLGRVACRRLSQASEAFKTKSADG
ncbi:MAG: hypothetical protein QW587_01960 [Candidatus Bathyarchaeia archaeon]